jgi:hypothetical protein
MGLFSRFSGLDKLVKAFPDSAAERQYTHTGQTVEIGAVVYKNCCKVAVSSAGLAIKARGNSPLIVPWGQLRFKRTKFLHWTSAYEYEVGEPKIATLSVKAGLQEMIKPFLGPGGA